MHSQPTIFALSSGQVPSGIAVIRCSGPHARAALAALTKVAVAPRRATRAALVAQDGSPIDDALVLWFPAPRSATGEDVVEFHCHGGRAVIASVFAALGALDGFRVAEPGEFTRRAFENGKFDLVAAEALDDLIHADTDRQRRQALRQLRGLLGDRARVWRQSIIDASALVEAGIDFADEADVSDALRAPAMEAICALRDEIADVLAQSRHGERLRDGLSVAITGPPNAGKSALLNRFAGRDVAIVSPHAGTTRDLLEVQLDLGGYPVTLIDTAGLRDTDDPVEREGIRRASARASEADLVLRLSDRTAGPFEASPGPVSWVVHTKADIRALSVPGPDHFVVSARTGEGVESLSAALTCFAAAHFADEGGLVTRARQRALLRDALAGLEGAAAETEPELIAEQLRAAAAALGRLLGRVDVEDMLGAIFSRFCIGK